MFILCYILCLVYDGILQIIFTSILKKKCGLLITLLTPGLILGKNFKFLVIYFLCFINFIFSFFSYVVQINVVVWPVYSQEIIR